MKTNLRLTIAALGLAAFSLCAQTEAELDIQTYAGLTITGEVGKVYSIEYVTDLAEPAESDWRCLEYLQLPASPYLWTDKSAPATGQRCYRAVAMEPPENMVFIPPGTFRMGSPTNEVDRWDNEGPQTDVIISQGFWMGMYEVTQGEYLDVMGTNPSDFQPPSHTEDLSRPVEQVNWSDAAAYCVALTEREKAATRIPSNSAYRLPTEAEWEYAGRAWTSTRFSYGDDPGYTEGLDIIGYTNLAQYAWIIENSNNQTHPVGQKLPNSWGLYDMHGNVSEWCQDRYSDYLSGGIAVDPQGPNTSDDLERVRRGGHYFTSADRCRSAARRSYSSFFNILGFRVVLAPAQP